MSNWTPPNAEYPPPKTGEPEIHRAARLGDHDEIHRLAARGVNIDEQFDIRLDPGARPHPATPLMVAAGSGDGASIKTVRLLLDLGADPQIVTEAGSAIAFACGGLGWNYRPGGDAERLRLVLESSVPLPNEASKASVLVCDAAGSGDAERLRVLLDAGLSPNHAWIPEAGAERAAQLKRYHEDFDFGDITDAMPEDMRDDFEESLNASQTERADSLGSAPWSHEIPLFCAAESGSVECVRMLLNAGADTTQRDDSRRTAMYRVTSEGAARVLLDAGVPIKDRDEFGWTPLDNAVGEGEDGIAKTRALLACGADPNATHDRGYTVLMSAVGSGRHPEVLRLLVEAGADPHAVSDLGYNAFHAAVDVNGEVNEAQSVRSTLTYLKQLGVDIEHRNQHGHTPLARAIDEGTATEVAVLCELGADPDAICPMHLCGADSCGHIETPLLIAAATGTGVQKDAKVAAVLGAGADPLVTDNEGFTPFLLCVAELCADAGEYEGTYKRFFEEIRSLKVDREQPPTDRGRYVAEVIPILREFVTEFALGIPIPETSEFAAQRREERIGCIAQLAAHESWARRIPQSGTHGEAEGDRVE